MDTQKPLNVELSLELGRLVDAQMKACYWNARRAQARRPKLLYVEGWFYNDDLKLPIEHAWLESDSETIDPTLSYLGKDNTFCYFPTVKYTRDETVSLWKAGHRVPFLESLYGHNPKRHMKVFVEVFESLGQDMSRLRASLRLDE